MLKRMNVTLGDPYVLLEINHSDTLTTPLIRQGPSNTHTGPAHSLFGPRVSGGMDEGSGGGGQRRRRLGGFSFSNMRDLLFSGGGRWIQML